MIYFPLNFLQEKFEKNVTFLCKKSAALSVLHAATEDILGQWEYLTKVAGHAKLSTIIHFSYFFHSHTVKRCTR
jgi:hypothetical protein